MAVFAARDIPLWTFVYTVDRNTMRYRVTKFDGFLNVEHFWIVNRISGGRLSCGCWQGKYGVCKHRPIIYNFNSLGRTNRKWFYDYEHGHWYMPIPQPKP